MSSCPSPRSLESATRKASPARRQRAQSLRALLAFIKDQILQFWPPYRHEETDSSDDGNNDR
jgi:hypothetical protein